MNKLLSGAALCTAATFLLAGCDDSTDDGGNPINPPPGTISYVGSPNVIAAWADPSTLAFDGPDVGSYAGKRQFARGNIDPLTGLDLGQQAGVEIWKGNDGQVHAVDLTTSGTPAPVQVSSEAGATVDAACTFNGTQGGTTYDYQGVLFAADLATPTNSSYVYRLPGVDGVCGSADDVVHVVKTGMSATDAPLVGAAMPATAIFAANGGLEGFVAKSGADLVKLDANDANPVTIGSFGATIGVADPLPIGLESGYPTGRLFVVDGNIVHVDYAAGTTSAALFAIPGWTATDDHLVTAASPTTLYFAVNTPASGATAASAAIYAMPADGSAPPLLMSLQPGLVREMQFPVQGESLVVGVAEAGAFSIVALPAGQSDGSAGTAIASGVALDGGRFTATASDVYYTMWASSTVGNATTRSNTQAGIVGLDGSVVQAPIADAQFLFGGEVDPWAAGDTTTQRTPFTTVFEVTGLTSVTVSDPVSGQQFTADGVAGGTLSSIDTSTNTTIATLGSFPTGNASTLLEGTFRGIAHTFFIEASTLVTTQDPATRELFLVNSRGAGSLTQVTGNLNQ